MRLLILKLLFLFFTFNQCNSQKESSEIITVGIETIQKEAFNKKTVLLDVRTPAEYKRGYIGNAINANIYTSDFLKITSTLDKSMPVYVYCHKGVRSYSASKKLIELGFQKVYDFEGGWKAWKKYYKKK